MADNSRLKFGRVTSTNFYRGGIEDNGFIRIYIANIESGTANVTGITTWDFHGLEYILPGNNILISTGTTPSTFEATITAVDYTTDGGTLTLDPAPNFNAAGNPGRPAYVRLQKGLYFLESSSLTTPDNSSWNYSAVTGSLDDEYDSSYNKFGVLGQLAFTSSAGSLIGGYFGQYEIIKTFSDRTNTNLSFFVSSSTGALSEDEDKSIGTGFSDFGIVELSSENNLGTIFDGGDIGSDSFDSLGLSSYAAAVNTVFDSNLGGGGFPYTGSALITGSLGITGSANFLKGEGETDFFLIRSSSFTSLKMNSDGVAVFGGFNSLPTAIAGGFAYSASNFYAGIE